MPDYPDPVQIAPSIYKVLFENDKIRILEIKMKPGDKSEMHYHPESFGYMLSSGKAKMTAPDGTSQELPMEVGPMGQLPAGPHAVENIGGTEAHALQIEFK